MGSMAIGLWRQIHVYIHLSCKCVGELQHSSSLESGGCVPGLSSRATSGCRSAGEVRREIHFVTLMRHGRLLAV